jgi:hypothetical protein
MLVDVHGTVIASSSTPEVGTSFFTRFDDARDEFEQALHRALGYVYCLVNAAGKTPVRDTVAKSDQSACL